MPWKGSAYRARAEYPWRVCFLRVELGPPFLQLSPHASLGCVFPGDANFCNHPPPRTRAQKWEQGAEIQAGWTGAPAVDTPGGPPAGKSGARRLPEQWPAEPLSEPAVCLDHPAPSGGSESCPPPSMLPLPSRTCSWHGMQNLVQRQARAEGQTCHPQAVCTRTLWELCGAYPMGPGLGASTRGTAGNLPRTHKLPPLTATLFTSILQALNTF